MGEGIRIETVAILIPYTCTDHSLSSLDTCSFKNVADLSVLNNLHNHSEFQKEGQEPRITH